MTTNRERKRVTEAGMRESLKGKVGEEQNKRKLCDEGTLQMRKERQTVEADRKGRTKR